MSDYWRDVVSKKEEKFSEEAGEPEKVKLSKDVILKMSFYCWREFDDPYYAGFAPMVAYYFFMASVPMLIVLSQVLGLFDVSMDFIRTFLNTHMTSNMTSAVSAMLTASSTKISNVIMLLLALWSASGLAYSLSRLSTYTLTNGRYRYLYFSERGKAIPVTILIILATAFSLVVYVYGNLLTNRLITKGPLLILVKYLKAPLLAAMFFAVIVCTYYLLPRIRVPLATVVPGSIVATVGIMIVTIIYSVFTMNSTKNNILYGAFSNIVALMLWFYLISWVLLIGMIFNKAWDKFMQKGRLKYDKLREYIYEEYPNNGEEMFNKLIIGDYDIADRSLDSIAVKFSRKFDPGYDEKRERDIKKLEQERDIRMRIEQELAEQREEEAVQDEPGDPITEEIKES